MVSVGTLLVFWFVAVALIWRRMHVPGAPKTPLRWANELLHLFAMIGFSLGFVLVWTLPVYNTVTDDYGVVLEVGKWKDEQGKWLTAMAVLCAATPLSMYLFCKPTYIPSGYKVPLYPLIPCASIFVNTFLLGQISPYSYKRFGWWTLGLTLLYILYGVFAAQVKDDKASARDHSNRADPSKEDDDLELWVAAVPSKLAIEMGPVAANTTTLTMSCGSAVSASSGMMRPTASVVSAAPDPMNLSAAAAVDGEPLANVWWRAAAGQRRLWMVTTGTGR